MSESLRRQMEPKRSGHEPETLDMPETPEERRIRLALQVVDLAKSQVLADNHFLSAAIGRLPVVPDERQAAQFATDGAQLTAHPQKVLDAFLATDAAPKHDLLHTVLHCVFLHRFIGGDIDSAAWTLACDMAAERVVAECCGPRPGERGAAQLAVLRLVEREAGARPTAEQLYRRLREGAWAEDAPQWTELFLSDDHSAWYPERADRPEPETHEHDDNSAGDGTRPQDNQELEPDPDGAEPHDDDAQPDEQQDDLKEEWRQVANTLAVNLQTFARNRGSALAGFVDDLVEAVQEPLDYREFLFQFATLSETMRLSDDEFDYVFYTYGLKLYKKMPLIEPLEYRDDKRVREFVLVLDTSGSVQGDAVQKFVEATFDILKSTESFHDKVHVRIIQCDTEVRSDHKITNLDELDEWGRTMTIHGMGSTDFRPAFTYVDELIQNRELENLGGLVYFTDGWGIYPEWTPAYKTAFCFYDENHRPEDVPPWAIQVVLDDEVIAASQATEEPATETIRNNEPTR